jgi:NAD(P)-dependent dehydrogenase (short-subunit alcohol dehydrogenase family)
METFDLRDHVSVITGGNGGIGLGMAKGLVSCGASVVVWGTNETKNAAAVAELEAMGGRALAIRCNVGDEASVVEAFEASVNAFGKVDSCFANAGVSGNGAGFTDVDMTEWRRVMSVNLDGVFLTLREAARHLIGRGAPGALVAVSSTSAIHGAARNIAYGTAKTALLGMVRGLAVELARHRIRVNALLPGWTETELTERGRQNQKFVENTTYRTPLRRWGQPDEFAPVGAFLADPSLSFHTGDSMVVDGGYTIF